MRPQGVPDAALDEAFHRQRRARDQHGGLDRGERLAALASLEKLLRDNADAIIAAVDRDFQGRAAAETRLLELFPSLEAIRHARRHLPRWMRPRRAATSLWFRPGTSRVVPQPLGVVGVVVPWNYPIYLAVAPLVSALAAGNRCLVKMSEIAPATGALFARLVAERFSPDVLAVVNGGPDLAREFVALPFDHLLFTGSTAVGREVMRAAAANLTPVTLELGGKSPAIVGRGIAIEEAAARILYGKCLNAGQTCIAPDYALVPRERVEAFVAAAGAAVARMYPRLRDNPDYTAIVNPRHRARLAGYLEEAREAGATVVELNPGGERLEGSPKIAPTLLLGAPESLRLMNEEIFGPLLPVVPYESIDAAIAYVNTRPRPLALYVFDHDERAVARIVERTVSGGVTVNETLLHVAQEELPFGGVGPSGMGEYHGEAGFERFSKRKAVFRQSRFSGVRFFRPPYGKRFHALLKLLTR
jgi:acyl-CoA reductase-like NAD-dependent aldehyde dehydrogenase